MIEEYIPPGLALMYKRHGLQIRASVGRTESNGVAQSKNRVTPRKLSVTPWLIVFLLLKTQTQASPGGEEKTNPPQTPPRRGSLKKNYICFNQSILHIAMSNSKKKVFVSGCFDMLHSGHIAFLQEASGYGDLYIGLGSDKTIRDLKGRETINSEEERVYILNALSCVHKAFS